MPETSYADLYLYRRVVCETRPCWAHIGLIFLVDVWGGSLLLLTSVPVKIGVDNVIGSAALPRFIGVLLPSFVSRSALWLLLAAAIMQVLLVLIGQLQDMAGYVLRTSTGEKLTLDFRSRLFERLQRLSLAFHDVRGTADSIYRVQYDAPSVQYISIYDAIPLVSAAVTLLATIYVTARIDWELAGGTFALSPFLFSFSRSSKKQIP